MHFLKVGQTRFHKSQHFDLIAKSVPYLSEKSLPGIGGEPLPGTKVNKFPSVYARGEVTDLPSWLVYDKQVSVPLIHHKYTTTETIVFVKGNVVHSLKLICSNCYIYYQFCFTNGTIFIVFNNC